MLMQRIISSAIFGDKIYSVMTSCSKGLTNKVLEKIALIYVFSIARDTFCIRFFWNLYQLFILY